MSPNIILLIKDMSASRRRAIGCRFCAVSSCLFISPSGSLKTGFQIGQTRIIQ
ncbi:hypothetical protein [Kingella oralis]|uniref:hypothetical protein n=1 Tax=Kingella oralis TaxID=505 RepID=UPI0028E8D913|nr:hypothetical protein [Kingella oralis]